MALHIRALPFIAALSISILAGCAGSGSVPAPNQLSLRNTTSARLNPVTDAPTAPAWLQPYFNGAHTGFNPLENTLKRSNVANLAQLWSFQTSSQITDPVLVRDNVAYINSGTGYLYAVNATSGAQIWQYETYEGSSAQNAPVIADGRLILPCLVGGNNQKNAMCGIDLNTGKRVWNHFVDCNCLPPAGVSNGAVASGDTVVFDYENGSTSTSYLIALNANNGAVLWSGDSLPHGPNFWSSAIADNQVLFSTGSGVCAASLSTGAQNWCTNLGSEPSMAVSGGVVYVDTSNNGVYALNATNGAQIWQMTPNAGNYSGGYDPPAIANGIVYVAGIGCCSPELYGIRASTGAQIFDTAAAGSNANTASSPSVANGIVYVTCQEGLCAFNSNNGTLLYGSNSSNGTQNVSPAIVNGVVYTNCGPNGACAYSLP